MPLLAGFTDTWHFIRPFKPILEQGSGIEIFDLLLTMWKNSVFPQHTHTLPFTQMRFSGTDLLPTTLHSCPPLLPGQADRIPPNSCPHLNFTTSSLPHRVSAQTGPRLAEDRPFSSQAGVSKGGCTSSQEPGEKVRSMLEAQYSQGEVRRRGPERVKSPAAGSLVVGAQV